MQPFTKVKFVFFATAVIISIQYNLTKFVSALDGNLFLCTQDNKILSNKVFLR